MKFSVLYLTNIFSDTAGGSEYMFWLYAKYMARKGHDVYVMCFKRDENSLVRLRAETSKINIVELVPEVEHKGVLFQDLLTNIKYLKSGFCISGNLYRDVDLVHSNPYTPILVGGLIKKLYKKAHVVTFHDIGTTMGIRFLYRWFREGGSSALASYVKALVGVMYESSIVNVVPKDAIVVPSPQSKRDVDAISLSKVRMYILPNFIDTELYEKYKSKFKISYEPCLLYIGRLVFYKNVHTIIKSFGQILQYNKDVKLFIIGDGPLRSLLYSYIRKHRLEKNIIMLGLATQEEKLKYLSRCTATINLSIYEGFGLTVLESWYFEKPVIVSDIPPLNEIVETNMNGYTVNPLDRKKLTELMIQIIDDSLLASRLGRNGLDKVKKDYTPEAVIPRLEEAYNDVLISVR